MNSSQSYWHCSLHFGILQATRAEVASQKLIELVDSISYSFLPFETLMKYSCLFVDLITTTIITAPTLQLASQDLKSKNSHFYHLPSIGLAAISMRNANY